MLSEICHRKINISHDTLAWEELPLSLFIMVATCDSVRHCILPFGMVAVTDPYAVVIQVTQCKLPPSAGCILHILVLATRLLIVSPISHLPIFSIHEGAWLIRRREEVECGTVVTLGATKRFYVELLSLIRQIFEDA